jgi:PiT family inorganic phosphate transporter
MLVMSSEIIILALVVFTALAFDFTNGFHDTANAMATSIATGALKPKTAVILSAVLNLIGAFLSVEVALTVTNAVIKIQEKNGAPKEAFTGNGGTFLLLILLAGLVGAIVWNLFTWLLGLPVIVLTRPHGWHDRRRPAAGVGFSGRQVGRR